MIAFVNSIHTYDMITYVLFISEWLSSLIYYQVRNTEGCVPALCVQDSKISIKILFRSDLISFCINK